MRQGTCCECGQTGSITSFYGLNGRVYCNPCVWKASKIARDSGQPSEYIPFTDNTVCARCGADSSGGDFPVIGEHAFCPICARLVSDWPYPQWLKIALLSLLALLAIALVHGRKYFRAGRTMYLGERLVDEHRYAEALPYLEATLQVAPGSDKAVLLTAKAALLSGDVEQAEKALQGHNEGKFEDADSSEFREVQAIWDRAVGALKKAEEASKLANQEGGGAESARLMHEAARMYPEDHDLQIAAEHADLGVAFDAKDFDRFLSIAVKDWKEYPGSGTAATVASALACKYVVTRDPSYRQQAEEMLATAQRLAQSDAEAQTALQEYAERIRYRLEKREIISRQEYDRRFRAGKVQKGSGG